MADEDLVLEEAEEAMKKSLEALQRDVAKIRTSRANPVLLEGVMVDYYDTPTPLKKLATITAPEPDERLRDGQVLNLGDTQWTVLHTPGHTPGGVSYYCPQARAVLTGDALFDGSIGRTDIPGGSASTLLRSVRQTLMSLPGETKLLAGHGPPSTIEVQKARNPFVTGPQTV